MDLTRIEGMAIIFVIGVIVALLVLIRLLDKMYPTQRERRGYDVSWIVVGAIFLCVIIAGVLKNKGLI